MFCTLLSFAWQRGSEVFSFCSPSAGFFSTLLSLYLAAFNLALYSLASLLFSRRVRQLNLPVFCVSLCTQPLSLVMIFQQKITQKTPTYNVCAQVNEQDGDSANGHWNASNNVDEKGTELSNILRQGVGNGFLQVVKDQAAWGKRKETLL